MREEAAKRRGKFFAAPVSGLAGLVQVTRLETGTRGPEHGARKRKGTQRPAARHVSATLTIGYSTNIAELSQPETS